MTVVASLHASAETATQNTWYPLVTRNIFSGLGCSRGTLPPTCWGVTRPPWPLTAKGRVGTEGRAAFPKVLPGRPGRSGGPFPPLSAMAPQALNSMVYTVARAGSHLVYPASRGLPAPNSTTANALDVFLLNTAKVRVQLSSEPWDRCQHMRVPPAGPIQDPATWASLPGFQHRPKTDPLYLEGKVMRSADGRATHLTGESGLCGATWTVPPRTAQGREGPA